MLFITIILLLMSVTDLKSFTVPYFLSVILCIFCLAQGLISFNNISMSKLLILTCLWSILGIQYIIKKEGIGGADILILSALLIVLTYSKWIEMLYLSIILGAVHGIVLKLIKSKSKIIPFLPSITISFIIIQFLR